MFSSAEIFDLVEGSMQIESLLFCPLGSLVFSFRFLAERLWEALYWHFPLIENSLSCTWVDFILYLESLTFFYVSELPIN